MLKKIVIILCVLILFLLCFCLVVPSPVNIFYRKAGAEFTRLSRFLSSQLENFFQQEQDKLDLITRSQLLKVSLFQYSIDRRTPHLKRYIQEVAGQNSGFEGLFLLAPEGKKIASFSRREFETDFDLTSGFGYFFNRHDRKYYFYLVRRIENNFRQVLGFLVSLYSYSVIPSLLGAYQSPSSGDIMLLDKNGVLIYDSFRTGRLNRSYSHLNLALIRDTAFFTADLDGESRMFAVTRSEKIPFYTAVNQTYARYISSYITIISFIAIMALVLIALFILILVYYSRQKQTGGIRLYDAYFENLSNAIFQMAKTSEIASHSSQMAYESTRKEVEVIKTLIDDFYRFMSGPQVRPAARRGGRGKAAPPAAGKDEKSEPALQVRPDAPPQPEKSGADALPEKPRVSYPSEGLVEEDGQIREGAVTEKDLNDIAVSNQIISAPDDKPGSSSGLTEEEGMIRWKEKTE